MATRNPFDQQKAIPGVKKIIAVSSGKGGVGKSTISSNLAMALSKNFKVGYLDTDIYGPSAPRIFGTLNQQPDMTEDKKLVPIERFGVKIMSIGFLVGEDEALVWRGPMLFKAIDQFLRDVEWGELDYLILDLPPGTGDVQLTLAQKIPISGAITVTTPQNMSLIDAKRSVDMWNRVEVPNIGVIENMSYMEIPGTGEKTALFPKGDLDQYLNDKSIEKIAEIPFVTDMAQACEMGIPYLETKKDSATSMAFYEAAERIIQLT